VVIAGGIKGEAVLEVEATVFDDLWVVEVVRPDVAWLSGIEVSEEVVRVR
jgi:hypothetical protein